MSALEEEFALQLRAHKIAGWVREHRFCPPRRWRADFAWPAEWLLVEIEGGVWSGGRHTRGGGFESDCEKYNTALEQGYGVLRYTPGMVRSGVAVEQVARVLGYRLSGRHK